MALNKVTYQPSVTVIRSTNLNDIQDEIIRTAAYGTCSTAGSAVAKVASLTGNPEFTLATGAKVSVKFTYANTAASPTLNVANTGAKSIRRYGTTGAASGVSTSWGAGEVVDFVYDGSYWQMIGKSLGEATTSAAGLMSATDKTKVDALGNVANLTYTVVSEF